MTEFQETMAYLINMFGEEVEVFPGQGYSGDSNDFWQTDDGFAAEGEKYWVILEDSPSDRTLEQPGFDQNAESAIWASEDIADEGDKIQHVESGAEWLVISDAIFRTRGNVDRQLLGLRRM